MQVSVDWLKDYVPLKADTRTVADRLTMTLNEVDAVRSVAHLKEVVVGEILTVEPHPNADNLTVVKVATSKNKQRTIVCGAPNVEVGQRVPVAVPGTTLPSGLAIEKREIRGITSDGMLCSPRELGAGDDHSGIWILPSNAKVGAKLPAALGRRHDVFELEVLANRPDCMGHLGIAREVAAAFEQPFTAPKLRAADRPKTGPYRVKLQVTGVDRYGLGYLTGLKNQRSPAWLQRRLIAVGSRPINAVVDVTNFVMLEYGQPLHAMDAAKVDGKEIRVRAARKDEPVTTLDGTARTAPAGALLIADSRKALGFAGIMGAANCEVTDQTTEILLECAHFDPAQVRRASRTLGLRTDASARFEKGISAEFGPPALRRAIDLILEITGGKLVQRTDTRRGAGGSPARIPLELEQANAFLGTTIPATAAKKILLRLGFAVSGGAKRWQVTVPYWRTDISRPVDLYEELIRHYGYEQVPEALPAGLAGAATRPPESILASRLRELLIGAGSAEVLTHSLVGPQLLERSGFPHKLPEIANPLSDDFRYLRGSLGPRHLEAAQANLRWQPQVNLFEIGRVFEAASPGTAPLEQRKLLVTVGAKQSADTFADARGLWTLLSERLRLNGNQVNYKAVEIGKFTPGRHFQIRVGNARVGWIAEFRYPERFKAKSIAMLSLNLDRLLTVVPAEHAVRMPPQHPPVYRDLSVYLPERTTYSELEAIIRKNGRPHLASIGRPDLFTHQGQRSITVRLEFRTTGRTLTDGEVNRLMANIEASVKSHGWKVRG